jgi:hypothetical protein
MKRLLCLVVALVAWPVVGQAQVTYVTSNVGTLTCSSTTGASTSVTVSGSNTFAYIIETHFDTSTTRTTTVTAGGSSVGITLREAWSFIGDTRKVNVYYLIAPTAGALTFAASYSGTVDGDCGIAVVIYSGVSQSAPLGTEVVQAAQNSATCSNAVSGGSASGRIIQAAWANSTMGWSHTLRQEAESLDGGSASFGLQDTSGDSATMVMTLGGSTTNVCIGDAVLPASAGAVQYKGLLLGIGGHDPLFR